MKSYVLVIALFAALFALASGHSYHIGKCPVVEPMTGFQMPEFLGLWYSIQKTSTLSKCLTYNFTLGQEPGDYLLEQVSEHPMFSVNGISYKYRPTGLLQANPDVPANMTVKFNSNPAGKSSFIVFMSDYQTYAGIFTCQQLPGFHRQSTAILSRTRTLDENVVEEIRTRMTMFGVEPLHLYVIDQSNCTRSIN